MKSFAVLLLVSAFAVAAVQPSALNNDGRLDSAEPSGLAAGISTVDGTRPGGLPRSKRAPILPAIIGVGAGLTGITAGGVAIGKAGQGERCRDSGCHKGYCWAWCGITHDHGEWCYTTKTYSQSYKYVQCSSDSECNGCWHCAGPCTL